VEDLAAVVQTAGGRAALVNGSAGCVLCLDAATALGDRITRLYLFEPPFIVNDGRPPMPPDYIEHVESLVAAGDRSAAVEYFMTEGLLIPATGSLANRCPSARDDRREERGVLP
jgi:hypothetical protein